MSFKGHRRRDSKGIGAAGASVVVNDASSKEGTDRVVAEIAEWGGKAQGDVSCFRARQEVSIRDPTAMRGSDYSDEPACFAGQTAPAAAKSFLMTAISLR